MNESAKTKTGDTERLNWLQEKTVDTIYLDDGRIIDVRGNDVRAAIDRAILRDADGQGADNG